MLQPASSSRRQSSVASSGLTPFNSGRTIPSKWDDAERWICSPVSSSYANNQHQLPRRPKSKSGPIVPPGAGYYSNYSPAIPLRRQSMVVKNLMMSSPFSTGVLAPDALSLHHYYAAHDTVFSPLYDDDDDDTDNEIQYSSSELNQNGVALPSVSSAPMWSELLCDPSSPNFQDEKCNGTKNEETEVSPFLRRDQGTQMSLPETENDSAHSSAKSSPSLAMNPKNCNSSKLEVRDVQVDNQAPVNKWSKQNHLHDEDLQRSSKEAQASSLDIAESTLDISKFHREEAKIIAWESLQKAKAEAAIRKLEMKLEKKRSSSMDKILKKLRRAQMKAEKMRSLTPVQQQGHRVCKTWKVFSFPKWSPSRCFSSHAL